MKSASKVLSLVGLAGLSAAIVFGVTGRGSGFLTVVFVLVALAAFFGAGVLGRTRDDKPDRNDGSGSSGH